MPLLRRGADRGTVDEAHRRTRGPDPAAVLLDVREQVEWRTGHAPGAVHVPLSCLAADEASPGVAQARPSAVICRSGHRSQWAAAVLPARGADTVDVKGGTQAWAAAGHPVVDERGDNGCIA
ncbi:rhodanese-like domain-containing protein [Streptomyces sp. NPDC001135]